MTYTSCISPPSKNPYIQIHEWQVKFCQENHCAAMLLAFFIGWHDWKLRNDQHYRRSNDIAETHGDGRPHDEDVYLFFSNEELQNGCLGFYGKKAINDALELLVSLEVISIHQNPNPRYHFDKTKHFKLYPHVCNRWIANTYVLNDEDSVHDTQPIDYSDRAKIPDASGKKSRTSGENARPAGENNRAIPNTTNNTTTKINNSPNAHACEGEIFLSNHERKVAVNRDTQPIVDALIAKGMSPKRFYPDSFAMIANLLESGATMELFCETYDRACRSTHGNGFGIPYLAKIITEKLDQAKANSKKYKTYPNKSPPRERKLDDEPVYEHDFKNGLDWMGDLVGQ